MKFHKLTLSAIALLALSSFSGSSNKGNVLASSEGGESPTNDLSSTAGTRDFAPPPENAETFAFEAEVSKMLDIVINSLYQNKAVFLRELISNASDALDKIRFLSISKPELLKEKEELEIRIQYDEKENSLTITDSGIGMTKEELTKNLGTVARSGTSGFLNALSEGTADLNMIGQFGVGFYSAFLVSDRVKVTSKSPSDPVQHVWECLNGANDFLVYEDPKGNSLGRGTEITLYLKEDAKEYADPLKIKELATHYSEFITHPIQLRTESTTRVAKASPEKTSDAEDEFELSETSDDEENADEETEEVTTYSWDKLNTNAAIWSRDKDSISDDEYQEFWKIVSKEPYTNATAWTHFNAEGSINFRSILYLPEEVPYHLKQGQIEKDGEGLKLYVRKVLISENFDLLPRYLANFIKGVVDSDDLPLNVNRENLQESKIIKVIAKKLTRKVIELMKKLSDEDLHEREEAKLAAEEEDVDEEETKEPSKTKGAWMKFYKNFAPSLKLGVIEDDANRQRLAKLLRFKSSKFSKKDEWVTLEEYVGRMKPWQKEIFFFPGEKLSLLKSSPFMHVFHEKDTEVLYFLDTADEYMVNHLYNYDGKPFRSITKEGIKFGDEDEDLLKRREKVYKAKFNPLVKFLKNTYGDAVTQVVVSKRCGEAPAVVSSTQHGHSANMERMMKAQAFYHGRDEKETIAPKVLEINPRHPFIVKLLSLCPPENEDEAKDFALAPSTMDSAWMLFDVALLNSGFNILNQKAFSSRMTRVLKSQFDVDSLELEDEVDVPEEEDTPPDFDETAGGMNMEDFSTDNRFKVPPPKYSENLEF
jgi:heat shock protein beta